MSANSTKEKPRVTSIFSIGNHVSVAPAEHFEMEVLGTRHYLLRFRWRLQACVNTGSSVSE